MSKVIYSKINKERKKEYQLLTSIVMQDSGERSVVKKPLTSDGVPHIMHMYEYMNTLKCADVKPASSRLDGDNIVMDYVEGESLCEILLTLLRNEDYEEALSLLNRYKDLVYQLGRDSKPFASTPEFEEVFGTVSIEGVASGKQLNIDCILENIIKTGHDNQIIDYEWFFDFYVPYNFLLYRALLDLYCNYYSDIKALGSLVDLCKSMGISEAEIDEYSRMNSKFIDYVYDNENGYNSIKAGYAKDKIKILELIEEKKNTACLYYDIGEGFSENNIICTEVVESKKDEQIENEIVFDLSGISGIKQLRFDPMIGAGFVKINHITFDNGFDLFNNRVDIDSDLIECSNGEFLFLSDDPKLVFKVDSDISKLIVSFSVLPIDNRAIAVVGKYVDEHNKCLSSFKEYSIDSCLYYDVGEGFSELDKMVKPIDIPDFQDYKEITLKFDLSDVSGIKQLRFDPMTKAGFVKINSIIINNEIEVLTKDLTYSPESVALDGNNVLFFTNDPQYTFNVGTCIYEIVIKMCVVPLNDLTIEALSGHITKRNHKTRLCKSITNLNRDKV